MEGRNRRRRRTSSDGPSEALLPPLPHALRRQSRLHHALTLLPNYIEHLGATGIVAGLFVTALSVGQTVAIVPVAWAGDRFDKRTILLVSLVLSTVAYALFPLVESPLGFILARTLQGLGIVGTGLVSLALVGDLAGPEDRARQIGKYNAWRMAAGILGSLGAGVTFDLLGFDPIFAALVALFGLTVVAAGYWCRPTGAASRASRSPTWR